jgi:hypothetical protein
MVLVESVSATEDARVREPPMPRPPTGDRGWMAWSAGVGSGPATRVSQRSKRWDRLCAGLDLILD